MNFNELLAAFTAAVEAGDGRALAALFSEDGVYADTFYGEAKGREAIQHMLEKEFYGAARDFMWEMHSPLCEGTLGYACWNFSFTSILPGSDGKRVVVEGISCFRLQNGLISHYSEKLDSGMALAQLDFEPGRLMKLFHRWNATIQEKTAMRRHKQG